MSATAVPVAPPYVLPSAQFRRRLSGFCVVAAFLVGSGIFLGFKPWLLPTVTGGLS